MPYTCTFTWGRCQERTDAARDYRPHLCDGIIHRTSKAQHQHKCGTCKAPR
jgi:hypothetical protein